MFLQELNLSDLFEDKRLSRLVTLYFESGTVISSVFHSLKSIQDRVEDVSSILRDFDEREQRIARSTEAR